VNPDYLPVDQEVFPDWSPGASGSFNVLTSSTKADSSAKTWVIKFHENKIADYDKSSINGFAVCVHDPANASTTSLSASERFTETGAGAEAVVSDRLTGLIWRKNPDSTTMTWQQALSHCEESTTDNKGDWRLPSAFELETLVDFSTYAPATFKESDTAKISVENEWYFSATTAGANTTKAVAVDFNHGVTQTVSKTSTARALCVRSAPLDTTIDCGAPSAPGNGTAGASSTDYGSIATSACDSDNYLDGTAQQFCAADGEWSDAGGCELCSVEGGLEDCVKRECTSPGGESQTNCVECASGYERYLVGGNRYQCRNPCSVSGRCGNGTCTPHNDTFKCTCDYNKCNKGSRVTNSNRTPTYTGKSCDGNINCTSTGGGMGGSTTSCSCGN